MAKVQDAPPRPLAVQGQPWRDPFLRFLAVQLALGAGIAALTLALICATELPRLARLAPGAGWLVLAGAALAGALFPLAVAFAATALEFQAQPPDNPGGRPQPRRRTPCLLDPRPSKRPPARRLQPSAARSPTAN